MVEGLGYGGVSDNCSRSNIRIIYHIYNWKQCATFNDIDTLVNQKVRIDLFRDDHNMVE